MHIEVFQGKEAEPGTFPRNALSQWFWHFRNKGRVTANAEAFPSKGNAARAAKACVTAVMKEVYPTKAPVFTTAQKGVLTIICWE